MSVSKQSLMSLNPNKTRNKLKTGLNEIECCWKKNAKHAQMQILVYQVSTLLLELSASVVKRISRRHAERQPIFTSLGSNPGRAITIFCPFPPLFSFFCHIQTFFYTNMNIFITLLENVNKSWTSANNLSLKRVTFIPVKFKIVTKICRMLLSVYVRVVFCNNCWALWQWPRCARVGQRGIRALPPLP
jgi:hypothetical protein